MIEEFEDLSNIIENRMGNRGGRKRIRNNFHTLPIKPNHFLNLSKYALRVRTQYLQLWPRRTCKKINSIIVDSIYGTIKVDRRKGKIRTRTYTLESFHY